MNRYVLLLQCSSTVKMNCYENLRFLPNAMFVFENTVAMHNTL